MDPFFKTILSLPLPEFILIIMGCLVIGFAIGFLWVNRKGGEEAIKLKLKKQLSDTEQWRLKYYDLSEQKDKELAEISATLKSFEEKEEIQAVEIEELSLLNQQLMLKQKNNTTQNSGLLQELETSKHSISQLENDIVQLKSENEILRQQLLEKTNKVTDIDKNQADIIDPSLIETLEQELLIASEKMILLQEKTARLEKLVTIESQSPRLLELVDTNAQLQTENIKFRRLVQELENDNIILKAQLSNIQEASTKADEEKIHEGLSNWGAQKLRKELEKLAYQNSLLETELNRLTKLEEIFSRQNIK
jgi:hypothetical protein